jgi:hypothetical protein
MVDQAPSPRRQYIDEKKDLVDKHRERAREYEKEAIEFAINGLRVLTYLNGGGLVAIPTAAALFLHDPKLVKGHLISAGLCFIAGLIFVVAAQSGGFFTMARRSEAELHLEAEQIELLTLAHFPSTPEENQSAQARAKESRRQSNDRIERSNRWRLLGMVGAWVSLGFFILGCVLGAHAILS